MSFSANDALLYSAVSGFASSDWSVMLQTGVARSDFIVLSSSGKDAIAQLHSGVSELKSIESAYRKGQPAF